MASGEHVTVLALGSAAALLGWTERRTPLADARTLDDLICVLEREAPRLADVRGRVRFAVNQAYASAATPLQPGDEVAIIPPVSGG